MCWGSLLGAAERGGTEASLKTILVSCCIVSSQDGQRGSGSAHTRRAARRVRTVSKHPAAYVATQERPGSWRTGGACRCREKQLRMDGLRLSVQARNGEGWAGRQQKQAPRVLRVREPALQAQSVSSVGCPATTLLPLARLSFEGGSGCFKRYPP